MSDCDYCGESFEGEEDHLRHLKAEHEGELTRLDQRRVGGLEEESSFNVGAAVIAFIVVGGFLVVGYLALSGGSGSDGPYGSIHEHGTFEMVVDGEAVDFNDPQYIENDPHFHFHGGDQVENSDRYVSHVHANGVTIQYALRTLGMSVNEAGTELSYDGTTYDASNEGTTINITVDGDPVDPGDYELGGVDIPPARQGEGDDVKIVVNSSG
mgnify:CR=1 FL=1